MRDDSSKWDAPRIADTPFHAQGVVIIPISVSRQTLISSVNARLHSGPIIEWPDIAAGAHYTLSIRRDRVLVVGGPDTSEGWNDTTSQAVSDATEFYEVFQISGPAALDLLKRGTELSVKRPSRSVARRLFEDTVLLYRHGAEDSYRLHVERAKGQAMWHNLQRQSREIV